MWEDKKIEETGMFNYSEARRIVEENPYRYKFPRPSVTTDIVVFSSRGVSPHVRQILLIKRNNEPFKDCWALPGGFLDLDETLKNCALRELREETGIDLLADDIILDELGVFDKIDRDPRDRVLSYAFATYIDKNYFHLKAGDDAKEVKWFDINKLPELAFDHKDIIKIANDNFRGVNG